MKETPAESRHCFQRMLASVEVASLRYEILMQPALWKVSTSRQDRVEVQRETESIFLRAADTTASDGAALEDIGPSRRTRLANRFPSAMQWVEHFAQRHGRELGRVLLAKLRPGGWVYRHVDQGEYYRTRHRYHLVIISALGSPLTCGTETQVMHEGEVWWFDNKKPHEAFNPSPEERVHLIFDLTA